MIKPNLPSADVLKNYVNTRSLREKMMLLVFVGAFVAALDYFLVIFSVLNVNVDVERLDVVVFQTSCLKPCYPSAYQCHFQKHPEISNCTS